MQNRSNIKEFVGKFNPEDQNVGMAFCMSLKRTLDGDTRFYVLECGMDEQTISEHDCLHDRYSVPDEDTQWQKVVHCVILSEDVYVYVRRWSAKSGWVEMESESCHSMIPADVVLLNRSGAVLEKDGCGSVRSRLFCPLWESDEIVEPEIRHEIRRAVAWYELVRNTYRPLGTVKPYKCFFSLVMFEKFVVSSEGELYLTMNQITEAYDLADIKRILHTKKDDYESLSKAFTGAFKTYCDSLDTGTERALSRFQMIDRKYLHEHYTYCLDDSKKLIAFYPYKTLKALGFDEIPELEGLVDSGFCELRRELNK